MICGCSSRTICDSCDSSGRSNDMKVPYSWLADWVDVPWNARELGTRLTMAGFELDALEPAAPAFTQVVVARILSAERHSQADKLQVCRVSVGQGEPLQIVCGASNARAGLMTALAMVGAVLPGGMEIKAAKLRGVESFGMLCSARELGLAESSNGIIELPEEAPVGRSLREYLELDDAILELNITANRGDAMSVVGIAREVAALAGRPLKDAPAPTRVKIVTQHFTADGKPSEPGGQPYLNTAGPEGLGVVRPVASGFDHDRFPVYLDAPAGCPTFVCCV